MRKLAIATVAGSALLTGVVAASAADMRVKALPSPPPPPFSWTGFYIGANIGGAWSPNSGTSDFGPTAPGFLVLPPNAPIITIILGTPGTLTGATGNNSGVIGGGQIGYNWQVNQAVFGVEADLVGTGLKGSRLSSTLTSGPPILNVTVNQTVTVELGHIDWIASFRGRLGYAADRTLFYVTGGAAVAGIGGSTTTLTNAPGIAFPVGTSTASNGGSTTRWGWTLGGGIEWAFNQNWSLAGEYRHTDFGNRGLTYTIPDGFGGTFATGTGNARLTVDQVTARLNYRFGGPVVARY